MDEYKVFSFEDRDIRTYVDEKGEPWCILKDVMRVLDLKNPTEAAKSLDEDELSITELIDSLGRLQKAIAINESGLYSLIMRSRKPQARSFKRWITHEVLPSIRKSGGYLLDDPKRLIAHALVEANRIIEKQQPKIRAYMTYLSGRGLFTVAQVAKTLGTGQIRLFAFLKDKNILMQNRQPYQRYIERGYFVTKMRTLQTGFNYSQTFVTSKGIEYIRRRLEEESAEIII